MRAKNEFKFIAEAYDTKLILERVVDGKLMCPKACCGAPVVECTCGPDCPHCNCFMIHKAMKEKGFTNKLLKEGIVPEDERDEPIRKRPEDNEEPKRGITGYQHTDALAQAAFAKKDKVDIDEIDLNRWREYPAEDVMKAVYRRYGKELPSVDSYDWAITWDKKVRPWLKENEGNL